MTSIVSLCLSMRMLSELSIPSLVCNNSVMSDTILVTVILHCLTAHSINVTQIERRLSVTNLSSEKLTMMLPIATFTHGFTSALIFYTQLC